MSISFKTDNDCPSPSSPPPPPPPSDFYTLKALSPINYDAVIFTIISWFLHYNDICWIGICYNKEKTYNEEEGEYRLCFASFMFLFSAAIAASRFTWWPTKLGPAPTGIINFLYKVWLGVLIHNFAENLIWIALYEFITYASKIVYDHITKILEALDLMETIGWCSILRGTFVRLILTFVSLSCIFRVINTNGFIAALILKLKVYSQKKTIRKPPMETEKQPKSRRQKMYKRKPAKSLCRRRSKTRKQTSKSSLNDSHFDDYFHFSESDDDDSEEEDSNTYKTNFVDKNIFLN